MIRLELRVIGEDSRTSTINWHVALKTEEERIQWETQKSQTS